MHPKAIHAVTKTFLVAAIIVLLLSIIVPTLTVLNTTRLSKRQANTFSKLAESESFNGVAIELKARAPTKRTLTSLLFTFDVKPVGTIANGTKFAKAANITIGERTLSVTTGNTIPKGEIIVGITDGDSNFYPLDKYLTEFTIIAISEGQALPVALSVGGQSTDFIFTPTIVFEEEDEEEYAIGVQMEYSRSGLQITFSFFAVTLMWLITLFTLGYSVFLVFTPQLPLLLVPIVSIAFALPRLRDSQPGIVELGASTDFYGFFPFLMNMVIYVKVLWNRHVDSLQ